MAGLGEHSFGELTCNFYQDFYIFPRILASLLHNNARCGSFTFCLVTLSSILKIKAMFSLFQVPGPK